MSGLQRFINSPLELDRHFTQVPNWWLRDERIGGNALAILLFVRSHDPSYPLTLDFVRKELDLGRTAFMTAREQLEAAGYLEVTVRRHPSGAVDGRTGRSIGGMIAGSDFALVDPGPSPRYAARMQRSEAAAASSPARDTRSEAVDNSSSTEPANTPEPVDNSPESEKTLIAPSTRNPTTDDPTSGFVHSYKKNNKIKNTNQSSSARARARAAPDGDDDSGSLPVPIDDRERLGLLALNVNVAQLLTRLDAAGLDPQALWLHTAAAEICAASPRQVGNPAAYIAAAIANEPDRWERTAPPEAKARSSLPSSSAPPTADQVCAQHGHRYAPEDPYRKYCARCSEVREGWEAEADAIDLEESA